MVYSRRKSLSCGPGCLCHGCVNVQKNEQLPDDKDSSSSDECETDDNVSTQSDSDEQLEEEIITDDNFYFCTYNNDIV